MGKSQTTAKNKYNAKSYDRISVTVKKGVKDDWKSKAKKQGLSLNAFIEQAVNQMMVSADDNSTIENTLAFDENSEFVEFAIPSATSEISSGEVAKTFNFINSLASKASSICLIKFSEIPFLPT